MLGKDRGRGGQQTVHFIYSEAVYRALSQHCTATSRVANGCHSKNDNGIGKQVLTMLHTAMGQTTRTHDGNNPDTVAECDVSNLDIIYRHLVGCLIEDGQMNFAIDSHVGVTTGCAARICSGRALHSSNKPGSSVKTRHVRPTYECQKRN
jgi:hypothetical protein